MADDPKDAYQEGEPLVSYESVAAAAEYKKQQAEIQLDKVRWQNRRRMAWICLWAMIVSTALLFFQIPVEKIAVLDEVIGWFYMAMATVIGTYMGTTMYASVVKNR